MGEGIFWFGWLILFTWFGFSQSQCQRDVWRAGVIKDSGFCIEAESSGQQFKKCYEVKEKEGE